AARFIGEGKPDEAIQQFDLIAEHCERTSNNKLLIDFTAFQANISLMDKYNLGEKSHIFASRTKKVATVVTKEQFDVDSFGETVARNRGVNLRTFTDFQTAEKWLLE